MNEQVNKERVINLEYRVPYADTDKMQVVYYANYFVYFERLRNELFRSSGVPYSMIEERGLQFPVAKAVCEYHMSAVYDDLINIAGWVSWIQGSRFQINYEITKDDTLLVDGHTIHVTINEEKKARRVPAEVLDILAGGCEPEV